MSYDALMRWEWEGGTRAPVSERREATPAEPVRMHSLGQQSRSGKTSLRLRGRQSQAQRMFELLGVAGIVISVLSATKRRRVWVGRMPLRLTPAPPDRQRTRSLPDELLLRKAGRNQ